MIKKFFNNNLNLSIFIISIITGIEYPDVDLIIPYLSHRSFLTHSIIVPVILYYFLYKYKNSNLFLNYIFCGFLVGVSIHLSADVFPKAWIGYATIKIPFLLSVGPLFSPIWILINIMLGLFLAFRKIKEIELRLSFKNHVVIWIIGIIYFLSEYNPLTKILFFISFTVIIIIFINYFQKLKKEY